MVALVLVSGLIAYVGDIVGRRLGRKRLSLFGLRPRHTAIAVSVVAGMVITIMTLLAAMAVSRDVKDGFLKVDEMRRRQAELAKRVEELDRVRAKTQRQLDTGQQELRALGADLGKTKKELAQADAALKRTEAALERAEAALKRAERAAFSVGAQSLKLGRQRDELQREVENLRARVAGGITLERATPVLFGAGQPLDWRLVDGDRPVSAIRQDLEEFIARLEAQARRAGAEPLPGEKRAIIIRKPIIPKTGDARADEQGLPEQVVWFDEDQVLEALAERIHETSGGAIVRAFSVFNTHPGEPVRVDFDLFRNHLVFRRGEALAQATMDGRQSEPALMGGLLALLREQVNSKARSHNIMPRPYSEGSEAIGMTQETVGDISIEELFAAVERLRAIGGPARVAAVAAGDTWTIGPLEVDLVVTPAPG
jgi:uncharacterized protein (DUF3084 family)